ncbi:SLC35B3 [Acanthosepion pharaonis]|uniref:Adenosine 3'-phospho 5'-phosphosulfate transporter 2 n=1 Tax=Acanthosepion pharaonis TaxID=158019 RepID=A0A812BXG4_ACAPH|nr:SLC35B3 [Sepia pharaonis]
MTPVTFDRVEIETKAESIAYCRKNCFLVFRLNSSSHRCENLFSSSACPDTENIVALVTRNFIVTALLLESGATDSFKGTEDVLKDTSMEILCFDLTSLPRGAQFLLCCGSVFFFYVIYGYFMELIFRLDGFRPFGWYLTLLQFAWYSIFGILESQIKQDFRRKAPLSTYAILAFLSVATIGLSNSSMGYLNFPTQQIFKSCKLIPVMIGGILIQGKRYGLLDVTACLSMCLGLAIFTIADSTVSPNFDTYGIFVIMLALCADAVIGNVQEKVMKQFNCSNIEMVLYSCSIGFVYIFVGLLLTGNLLPAIRFCSKHPTHTYGYAFIFSITGYLGLVSVLTLVKSFGALIAVTVTTCRKAITIILSFIFFTKPFTIHYVWSGFIVILGIMLNIYMRPHNILVTADVHNKNNLFTKRSPARALRSFGAKSLWIYPRDYDLLKRTQSTCDQGEADRDADLGRSAADHFSTAYSSLKM